MLITKQSADCSNWMGIRDSPKSMGGSIVLACRAAGHLLNTQTLKKSTLQDTHVLCEEFPMVPFENVDAQTFIIANLGHPVSKTWQRPWEAGHYIAMLCVVSLGNQKHGVAGLVSSIFFCY